jgi:hypothetical protein
MRVFVLYIALLPWMLSARTLLAQPTLDQTVRDLLASKETEIIKTFSYDSSLNQSFRALPPEALRVVSRLLEEDAFGRTEERLAALNLTSALLIRYARTSLDAGRALDAVRKILDVHSDDVQLLLITSGILSAYGTEEQDLPRFEALMPSVGVIPGTC